jgi:hypothetical protein
MKRLALVLPLVALLALPAGAAAAYSGTITDVRPAADGQVSATYTSSFSECTDYDYCGWFPFAVEVPADAACVDNDNLTYVGDFQENSGTQGPASDTYTPKYTPSKICLMATHASQDYVLAEFVYTPGSASPPPSSTPAPSGSGEVVAPMTIREARSLLPAVLRRRFHERFVGRTGRLRRTCSRLTREKVRCRVGWNYRRYRYSGSVTLQNDPADPARSYLSRTRVRRKLR